MKKPKAPLDDTTPFGQCAPSIAAWAAWKLATSPALTSQQRRAVRRRIASPWPGPFDVTVRDIRFRTYPTENRDDRILLGRRAMPEPAEMALIKPFLEPRAVFVDIGANVGTYSMWAARRLGAEGTVLAFEPHPRTFAKLNFNIAANRLSNVTAKNLAVARKDGTMTLYDDGGGNIGHASLLEQGAGIVRDGRVVAVRPLAAVAREEGLERIDLLKVDVEGFEDQALLPFFEEADGTLWPKAILIETVLANLWEKDCLSVLADKGYVRRAETAENVLLERRSR
ncbi:FkbM family methyltransferase [Nitratireductor mangrovi]|uniref:FkbM family methyltransferase n=1 Tax=Nitratireductor mangrovi TaxID=2599600 RepID=A0A5B8L4K2_9HYPH|nr:FkbM family methyltransferase [Nitratireductor mangrovi]QDZ02683.1 FkbM family methyltransferase [Nitratireductor mangrovi]